MNRDQHPTARTVCSHVRVRYAETDKMRVVYYANDLVWFEVGRTEWLRQAGFTYREVEESGIILPVIEVRCEYLQPARYDDDIEIRARGTLSRVPGCGSVTRSCASVPASSRPWAGRCTPRSIRPGGRPGCRNV